MQRGRSISIYRIAFFLSANHGLCCVAFSKATELEELRSRKLMVG